MTRLLAIALHAATYPFRRLVQAWDAADTELATRGADLYGGDE